MELLQILVTVYFSLGVSSKERLKVLYLLEKKKRKEKNAYCISIFDLLYWILFEGDAFSREVLIKTSLKQRIK